MKRVLMVVDVSNLYFSVMNQFHGRKLDYTKLLNCAIDYGEIYRAIAYGAAKGSEADRFKTALRAIGFELKYKEPKVYQTDVPGQEFRKADWDVGIVIDVVRMLPHVDVVVFCTADGDFAPCVEWVNSQGKIAIVIGCSVSRDLRNLAHETIEISNDMLDSARTVDVRSDGLSDAVRSSAF